MTDKIKLKANKFVNDKKLKLNYLKPKDLKILLAEFCEEQIAELKAECDLAIEGRDIKINELEAQIEKLKQDLDIARENANKQEQWEIYSVLNDIYNDNFEVITSVSN